VRSLSIFALCAILSVLLESVVHGAETRIFRKKSVSTVGGPSKLSNERKTGLDESFQESLAKLRIPDNYRLNEVIIGNKHAPRTIIVYLSFTCGHCKDFFNNELPKIRKKYIDSGKIRIYLRNYLDDLGALEAAVLVRCLGGESLSTTLELFQKVFDNQKEWQKSKEPRKFLENIFKAYGKNKIDVCTKKTKISAGLMKEQQRAHELEIMQVPAFVIDGKIYQGNLTCEKLEEILMLNLTLKLPESPK
jgi:protein-disulfide isomerase